MRICFDILGNERWTAGSVYLHNLFLALRQFSGGTIEIFLSNRSSTTPSAQQLEFLGNPPVLFCAASCGEKIDLRAPSQAFEKALKQSQIDIFVGSPFAHQLDTVPTISILGDFQHKHFPQFFSAEEITSRDEYFEAASQRAARVLLPSQFCFEDFKRSFPRCADKGVAFHPRAVIPETIAKRNVSQIIAKYKLPQQFLFFPSQYWKHKNHQLLFDAIAEGVAGKSVLPLVCAGNPSDYRFPEHFTGLQHFVAAHQLEQKIILLGLVEYDEILTLMRHATALVHPSLYEGYSMTVEEAGLLGTLLCISDIPAHREHAIAGACYFDPYDTHSLAQMLREMSQVVELPQSAAVRDNSSERKATAQLFYTICNEVVLATQ